MANPQPEDGTVRISNALYDAILRQPLAAGELKTFLFVIRKTYGWRKKFDSISFSQIAKATGISRRQAMRSIESLQQYNMIVVTPTSPGKPKSIGIQKDFGKWKVVTPTSLVTPTSPTSDTHVTTTSDTHVTHNRQLTDTTNRHGGSLPKPTRKETQHHDRPQTAADRNAALFEHLKRHARGET